MAKRASRQKYRRGRTAQAPLLEGGASVVNAAAGAASLIATWLTKNPYWLIAFAASGTVISGTSSFFTLRNKYREWLNREANKRGSNVIESFVKRPQQDPKTYEGKNNDETVCIGSIGGPSLKLSPGLPERPITRIQQKVENSAPHLQAEMVDVASHRGSIGDLPRQYSELCDHLSKRLDGQELDVLIIDVGNIDVITGKPYDIPEVLPPILNKATEIDETWRMITPVAKEAQVIIIPPSTFEKVIAEDLEISKETINVYRERANTFYEKLMNRLNKYFDEEPQRKDRITVLPRIAKVCISKTNGIYYPPEEQAALEKSVVQVSNNATKNRSKSSEAQPSRPLARRAAKPSAVSSRRVAGKRQSRRPPVHNLR